MATKKAEAPVVEEQTAFHLKYRPRTMDRIIGHEAVTSKLNGILKTKKFPSALAFFGPPSAGKTTLARAFTAAVNGGLGPDYKEVNAADERGIDDVRELVKTSKFRPQTNKRIIFIDEAHQLVSNNAAAQAFLKALEEPSPSTMWILGSMEQSKFTSSTVGKAMLTRCIQFQLEQHTNSDLMKQALRIARGEGMDYLITEDKAILKKIVLAANAEMRTLANLMQQVSMHVDAMEKRPKKLSEDVILEVVDANTVKEDKLAVDFMIGLLTNKYAMLHRATLDVSDQFKFMQSVSWISKFMLDNAVLNGQRHPKVWASAQSKEVLAATKELKLPLGHLAGINSMIVKVKSQALGFQMPATDLLTAAAYDFIKASTKKGE